MTKATATDQTTQAVVPDGEPSIDFPVTFAFLCVGPLIVLRHDSAGSEPDVQVPFLRIKVRIYSRSDKLLLITIPAQ
jgi:hypothetical protein